VAGAHEAVEDVEIATAGQARPRIERFIEASDAAQRLASECHIATGTEDTRTARIEIIAGLRRTEADALERMAKAAQAFEFDLRGSCELERQYRPRDAVDVGVRRPCFHEAFQPGGVDGDIVVEIRDEVSRALRQGTIAREVRPAVASSA
jgi:hypothetical protein